MTFQPYVPIQQTYTGDGMVVRADRLVAQVTYQLTAFQDRGIIDYIGIIQLHSGQHSFPVSAPDLVLQLPNVSIQLPILAFQTATPGIYNVMLRAPARELPGAP